MRHRLLLITGAILGVLLFASPAVAHVQDDTSNAPPPSPTPMITMQAGDSLWSLFGQKWWSVASFNHLADPNVLEVGQVLSLPPPGWVAPPIPASVPTSAPQRVVTTSSSPSPSPRVSSGGWRQPWACIAEGARGGARWGNGESGGNPAATPNGPYYGGLQFAMSTWLNNGGVGNPAYASIAEQEAVADRVLARAGWGQWPQTSRACGFR